MKKLFLLSILLPTFAFGNPFLKELISVNRQWAKNRDGISLIEKSGTLPNEDIIISHLILVEKTLRARSVNHLTNAQKKNRLKYLNILNRYHKTGIVPTNDYSPGRFPVFIDRKGVHCAVGYLLEQGGFEHVAQKINDQQKFAYIHQLKVPELMLWQQESGLTLDELAWIQPGYPYRGTAMELGEGLKGEVKDIKNCTGKYSLIAAGKFKIEEDTNFVILAGFDGQNWNSIITASGIINKIEVNGNTITSYGGDISFGNFNKVEILETDISSDEPKYKLLGEFDGEISDFETFNSKKYVCGKFKGGLAVWQDNNWVVIPSSEINNPTSIRGYHGKLYITGIKQSNNYWYSLVSFDGFKFDVKNYFAKLPSYLQVFNDKLFIGLKSTSTLNTDTLLYSFDGTTLQIFDSIKTLRGSEVKNIIVSGNKMLLTGNLGVGQFIFGMGNYGNGVALYNTKQPSEIKPIIYVEGFINSGIITSNDKIIIGGNFKEYYKTNMTEPLLGCGIAYENGEPNIVIEPVKMEPKIPSPNPTTGIISFPEAGKLFDINGKLVIEVTEGQYNLSELNAGVYIYVSEKNRFRIVKQEQ